MSDDNAKSSFSNPTILAAVIGLLSAPITWWISRVTQDPPAVLYNVEVKADAGGKPINKAKVTIVLDTTGRIPSVSQETDCEGKAYFLFSPLPKAVVNKFGFVQAEAAGYGETSQPEQFAPNQTTFMLRLPSDSAPAAAAAQAGPVVAPPVRTRPQEAVPDQTKAAAAKSSPPRVEPYTLSKTSGSVPSGAGANFSAPYTIESDPPRDGYKIVSASFSLSGDRSCNAWSSCRWKQYDENKVVFEFTLQGHNEWHPPGQANSVGTLTVNYGPK